MKGTRNIWSLQQVVSSLFMILALLWLTVSTPFVYADQLAQTEQGAANDDSNPFSNTTEEKNESSVNTLSEYLHDHHIADDSIKVLTKFYKCHPSDLYFAFHPELIVPPPEA